MVENYKSESQEPKIDKPVLPASNPKPDALEIIRARNAFEKKPETDTKESKEGLSNTTQITGQSPTSDPTDSSSGKQSDGGQTGGQTTVSSSTGSVPSMSDEEFQKAKEEQKQKSEQQPQESDSEPDQEYDYYEGQGQ